MDTAQTQVLYKTRFAPTRAAAEAAQQRQAEAIVRSQSGREVGETICGGGLGRLLGYSAAGHTHSGYSATDHEHGSTATLHDYACWIGRGQGQSVSDLAWYGIVKQVATEADAVASVRVDDHVDAHHHVFCSPRGVATQEDSS